MVHGYVGRILEIKDNAVLVGKYYIITRMRIALAPEVSKHMRANSDCLCHFNWCKLVTYRLTKAPAKNTGVTIRIFMLHFKHL